MLIGIIKGKNSKVISLPFTNNNVLKIGRNRVIDNKIYNPIYKMYFPIDVNLMIEGSIDKNENIIYTGIQRKQELQYYMIEKHNTYIFKKGKQNMFSSQDGNNDIFTTYQKLIC